MKKYKSKEEREKILDEFAEKCRRTGVVPQIKELRNSEDKNERYLAGLLGQVGKYNFCDKYNLMKTRKHSIRYINDTLDSFARKCKEDNFIPSNTTLLKSDEGKQIYFFMLKKHKNKLNFAKHYNMEDIYDKSMRWRNKRVNKLDRINEKYEIIDKYLKTIKDNRFLIQEDFKYIKNNEDRMKSFKIGGYLESRKDVYYIPRSSFNFLKQVEMDNSKNFEEWRRLYLSKERKYNTIRMFFYQRYGISNFKQLIDFFNLNIK